MSSSRAKVEDELTLISRLVFTVNLTSMSASAFPGMDLKRHKRSAYTLATTPTVSSAHLFKKGACASPGKPSVGCQRQ